MLLRPKKLLDQVRDAIRLKRYAYRLPTVLTQEKVYQVIA